MNNIYKVIWSKAKNCYVVASEIARSHTKSATGSEKIGGVTRRSLLASLMALSLLCGGLGVASAANSTVHVDESASASGAAEVYTKTGVDTLLADYGRKTEVETNKNNIANLQTTTIDQGQKIATNTADIANNKTAIDKKIDTVTADARYAAKADLIAKADATALDDKADKTAVAALEGRVGNLETTVGDASSGLVKDVNDLNTSIGAKANQSDLVAATNRITANEGNITELQRKTTNIDYDVANQTTSINGMKVGQQVDMGGKDITNARALTATGKVTGDGVDAGTGAITGGSLTVTGKVTGNGVDAGAGDITTTGNVKGGTLETTGNASIGGALTATGKVTGDGVDAGTGAITGGSLTVTGKVTGNGVDAGAGDITTTGNVKGGTLETTGNATIGGALTATGKVTGDGVDAGTGAITGGSLTVTGKVTGNGVDAGAGDITTTGNVKGGTLETTGNATIGGALSATGKVTGNGVDAGTGDITGGSLTVTGKVTGNGVDAGAGDITTTGNVKGGTLETTGDATIGRNLDVKGTLNTKDVTAETIRISKSEKNPDYKSEGSIIGEGGKLSVSNEKFDKRTNITEKSELNVNEKGTVNWATSTDATGNKTEGHSEVTADNIKNFVKKTEGGKTFGYEENITADGKVGTVTDKEGNTSSTRQDSKGIYGYAKDKDGNKSYTKQEGNRIAESVIGQDGKQTKSEMTSTDITNTAKDGTIKNDAKDIVNNATGDMTNNVGGNLSTTVGGNEIHEVKETKTETVEGKVTENFKNGQETNVTGNQDIHVTGKQTNTVGGGQENIISGGQTNTITGDQTTTITGNKTETVTENVTEDYKKDLTTTVGGNEIHDVKGTKTETVEGKVTENFKGGQETNVTGDQTTNVSGTQTTNATDINRNASSGMIDKVDNAYGTNTETKVAGKTTTEVSIKGTGETAGYIRGATESRDYLIKGTLKNSETKTAEATSTEITDGNGKTSSTIQDVTQISGSVTDGTNTSVSNVKANSIDSAVTDGSSISTINQKKNSITSQVTDGTTITKTEQDTKNITNTAKDGTITNDAKDIVNNASGNMTNTVGGDLTTTVRGNELHEVTGKQTNKIDGDQENTIGGNQTTTVTGDISNKAENITNEANTKLTDKVGENTRVLDSEGITDTVGGSTFKQRIDKIMMESKDVSIKAEETLTNEAKVITNKASEVINNEAVNINNTATGIIKSKASEIQNQADKLISNKVGENTWENMENGKITTSIKDGAKQNLTQSDAAGTTQSTVDGGKSTVTIQNADGLADAVTDGTNTSVQNQTASAIAAAVKDGAGNENASVANATTSVNTIKSGSKANTVISTADGTSFINSEAAAPVGDGTEVKTTIKGNTITTGKVTMDYAEVMKDLGVRGNANITGKTTTGSLEVTGTSTLKGDVTMESSATVKKNLTVEGNTNLKNTKVDGTLDVTQKATFGDSVSIEKDLSVGGDVTAKSYKVGDKTYISAAGINANDQKITNVADGSISEGSKDAVNGGQLYTVKNDLEGKVNKVGANAAAMANLHPMEFDPDSKWNIAAAIGNYGSETAAALGAFYRPNDDVMVNLSTAFGTGENMVGGGVSVRLGKGGNKLSREETNALKAQVADLTARMDALLSVLNPNMSKDFPDVPENHWAYEAVSRLAGNDIVQGYPDGEFHGERTMTRYEMAEIIYNALSRGAEAEKELVEEFKPELQAMAASEKATAEKAEG